MFDGTLGAIVTSKIQLIVVPIYLAFIFFESFIIRFFKTNGSVDSKDSLFNVSIGIMSVPINAAAAFITLGALYWAKQYQITVIPLTITTLVICFILDDLRFYIHHRICHRFRWQWGMHNTHHSSERFGLAVSLRQSWAKHFTGTMMLKIPLVLIGFDPIIVIFCGVLNATYQFFCHTETIKKLPWWYEAIFNTPSHHRVHHAKNPKYLDANYAGTLIIWDRMFGSFVEEDENDLPDYGLVTPLITYNPLKVVFIEYVNIFNDVFSRGISLKHRILYLFGPPGWSHDGSRMMSTDIKAQYYKEQALKQK